MKALRIQRGWSQGQLLVEARKHVPEEKRLAAREREQEALARETLSRIENGQPVVDSWITRALADALEVTVDQLFADEAQVDKSLALSRDFARLSDRMSTLPKWAQQFLLRLFNLLVTEQFRLIGSLRLENVTVDPRRDYLTQALLDLEKPELASFEAKLAALEAPTLVASANGTGV